MAGITRFALRWGLVSGLALGGAVLVWGPYATMSYLQHARGEMQSFVTSFTDDPSALRRQLSELADDYPDQIAEVRGELVEVEHQITEFERDIEVAQRVVAMTASDLNGLHALVLKAEKEAESTTRVVYIRFDGNRMGISQAYDEAQRIQTIRTSYEDRLAVDQQHMALLGEQHARLTEILNTLETEFSKYQAQIWQLDRQIDAIQRNGRLIELTEAQQETLATYERFGKVTSLRQIEGRLAELRAVQESKLQALSSRSRHQDYEARAAFDVDSIEIEINPFEIDAADDATEKPEDDSFAWGGPIVIEN